MGKFNIFIALDFKAILTAVPSFVGFRSFWKGFRNRLENIFPPWFFGVRLLLESGFGFLMDVLEQHTPL